MEIDRKELALTFWEFFSECFIPQQRISIVLKPEHKEVCDELEIAVTEGRPGIEFWVINIPPRFGKTKILEALACWQWSWGPEAQMIYTGVSVDLVEVSVRYISEVIQSEWYLELFPHVKVGNVCRADHVQSTLGGNLYGAGVGGTIIGKGAGLKHRGGGFFAIDDAAKPNEALSPTTAESVIQWFMSGPLTRRNSVVNTPIIICSQRLGQNDLPGFILENYAAKTKLIKIPALRDDGTSIMEETMPAASLVEMRDSPVTAERFKFAGQFQQDPVAWGGNLIPVEKFGRYDIYQPIKWKRRLITVDTALKTKEHNDRSALALWGEVNNRAYLIDLIFGRWESPDLVVNSRAFWRKHTQDPKLPFPRFTVEEKAAGTGLGQQLRREGIPVEGIERNIDKVTRVKEILAFIETGMVYIPRDQDVPWIGAYLSECAAFRADGKSLHDDLVDVTCDGVSLLLGRPMSILDLIGTQKPKRNAA